MIMNFSTGGFFLYIDFYVLGVFFQMPLNHFDRTKHIKFKIKYTGKYILDIVNLTKRAYFLYSVYSVYSETV